MSRNPDIEQAGEYKRPEQVENGGEESEALLPGTKSHDEDYRQTSGYCAYATSAKFSLLHLILAFFGGLLACLVASILFPALCIGGSGPSPNAPSPNKLEVSDLAAPSHVGSTERHDYPPVSPTNGDTSLFPTDVGYAGPTPTGAEPAVVMTAPSYPIHTGAPNLVTPTSKGGGKDSGKGKFDIFKNWGNLSPWYSINRGTFGVDSGPEAPEHCTVTGLHFLHRHGARYPTAWGELNLWSCV